MSKRKDTEATALASKTEPATAAGIETSKVESPKIESPEIETASAPLASVEASTIVIAKPDEVAPEAANPAGADTAPADATGAAAMVAAAMGNPAPPRTKRFAMLASAVALAAALGALVGGIGASGLSQSMAAPSEAAALPTANSEIGTLAELGTLQDTLAKLRGEVVALKTSVEAATRNTNAQFTKVAERFDRLERRADLTPSKETTGSVPPQAVAAVPTPPQPPQPPMVEGWIVHDVIRGIAILQGRRLGIIEVAAGDTVPGVGRIESIRKQQGKWVVVTSKGLITSVR